MHGLTLADNHMLEIEDLRCRIKKHAEVLQRLLREFDELQPPAELNVAEFRALLAVLDELHLEDSDEEMTRSSSEEARGRDPSTKQKVR